MRVTITDTAVSIEARDPALLSLARAALEALGDDAAEPGVIAGDLPAAVGLGEVWLSMRDAFVDIRRRATTGAPDADERDDDERDEVEPEDEPGELL
jgi:hypothetical protein